MFCGYPCDMTVSTKRSCVAVILLALAAPAQAQEASISLRVVVRGVEPGRAGPVLCGLWSSAAGWPMNTTRAILRARAEGSGAERTCTFILPRSGRYAVAVAHDSNGNGRVDTNLFGAPTEGWASTNDVTHPFSPPSFDESSIDVRTSTTARVRMHY
jgi:uncharacterized protein (DUF2141 family)